MRPLSIPRIRRLDLTERHWRIREIGRQATSVLLKHMLMPRLSAAPQDFPVGRTLTIRRPKQYRAPNSHQP